MITVNGRYPSEKVFFDRRSMTAEIMHVSKDGASIRIDNNVHADFWMEVHLNREELENLLAKMNEAEG